MIFEVLRRLDVDSETRYDTCIIGPPRQLYNYNDDQLLPHEVCVQEFWNLMLNGNLILGLHVFKCVAQIRDHFDEDQLNIITRTGK